MAKRPPPLDDFTSHLHDLPAYFANHIGANLHEQGVRLTFNESPNGSNEEARPRTAVFLTYRTLNTLIQLLMQLQGQIGSQKLPKGQQAN